MGDPQTLVSGDLGATLERLHSLPPAALEQRLDAVHRALFGLPAPQFEFVDSVEAPPGDRLDDRPDARGGVDKAGR